MNAIKNLWFVVLVAVSSTATAKTIELNVNGLVCAFCAQGIEKTMRGFKAIKDVFVDLDDHLVAIEVEDGVDLDDATLRTAIKDAGYTVTEIRRSDSTLQSIRERVAVEAEDD